MATLWFLFAVLCVMSAEPLVETTNDLQVQQSDNTEALRVQCPDSWLSHGARCFKLITSPLDWHNAEDHCRSLGGSLVSVHNHAENRYLKDLLQLTGQTDVWIGAFYLQSRWRWVDGTGLYYSDWIGLSSPANYPCAVLRSTYGWANSACSSSRRFICAATPGSC